MGAYHQNLATPRRDEIGQLVHWALVREPVGILHKRQAGADGTRLDGFRSFGLHAGPENGARILRRQEAEDAHEGVAVQSDVDIVLRLPEGFASDATVIQSSLQDDEQEARLRARCVLTLISCATSTATTRSGASPSGSMYAAQRHKSTTHASASSESFELLVICLLTASTNFSSYRMKS